MSERFLGSGSIFTYRTFENMLLQRKLVRICHQLVGSQTSLPLASRIVPTALSPLDPSSLQIST